MNFDLSDDQKLLKETARTFLDRECGSTAVRKLLDDPRGMSEALWSKIVELGWPGLAVPEEFGGLGLGFLDLAVVLEEAGRALLPGPFFSSAVLGAMTLADAGSDAQKKRWLPEIAAGRALGTLAVVEEGGAWTPESVATKAQKTKGGFTLSGRKSAVLDAHVADFLLVAARLDENVVLFLVEKGAKGLVIEPMKTVDGTRRIANVTLDGVKVDADTVVGSATDGWPTIARALDRAAAGQAAEMVGGSTKVLEMSVEYARIRVQFGRPIGSFQAIKHKCADMMVLAESARSAAYYAAWALETGAPDARAAASIAKAYASEAFRKCAGDGIQIHGGIGFTWEHDMHLFFKRAKLGEMLFGDPIFHRDRLVAQVV